MESWWWNSYGSTGPSGSIEGVVWSKLLAMLAVLAVSDAKQNYKLTQTQVAHNENIMHKQWEHYMDFVDFSLSNELKQ